VLDVFGEVEGVGIQVPAMCARQTPKRGRACLQNAASMVLYREVAYGGPLSLKERSVA
jgi:hypothetical protein